MNSRLVHRLLHRPPGTHQPGTHQPPPLPPANPPCSEYAKSMVVTTQAPKELGTLRAADGAEGLQDKKE